MLCRMFPVCLSPLVYFCLHHFCFATALFCYRALTQQITLNTALPPPTTLHCAAESFYVCGLLWSITVPVFHRHFGFLNFIVDISVILRYDSHKVQNFTEYWNDRFFAIFLLFCIMPKSAAAGLRFTFRISFPNIVHLP